MDNNPYYQKMYPSLENSLMAAYPAEQLHEMYPDTYKMLNPMVMQICERDDVPGNPGMHPYPTREAVESMVDEVYGDACMHMGIPMDEDDRDDYYRQPVFGVSPFGGGFVSPGFGFGAPGFGFGAPGFGFGFGRRRFLRDLIGILLISQLLRRRGFRY